MNADCHHSAETGSFVAGELTPAEHAEFEAHLKTCAACREGVESTRTLVSRLRRVPPAAPMRDLAPEILSCIRDAEAPGIRKRQSAWLRWTAAAAVFAAFAAGFAVRGFFRRDIAPSAGASVATVEPVSAGNSRALDWFVRNQEADGSWSAERWGGQRNYAPALTALPLLALVTSDEKDASRVRAAALATAKLLSQQNADGTFGPAFQGSPYNTSIATLALLHAWHRNPSSVPKPALDAAVSVLAQRQSEEGGWGYHLHSSPDRSITQWHVQALEAAATLGWKPARAAADRGLRWLSMHSTSLSDAEEPADSTSVVLANSPTGHGGSDARLDFYETYFAATALKHESATIAHERLARLRRELLVHQINNGNESGSWPPDDQWGRAGGRLYSTALASLTLQNL